MPVAAFFVIRFLRTWPGAESRPRFLVPGLALVVVLVEIGLVWRLARVLKRVGRGRSRE